MSGGSLNYLYSTLSMYEDEVFKGDKELIDLYKDFADLLHDYEWYTSGDYGEGTYNETKIKFKKKWFEGVREDRILKYIDETVKDLKQNLGINATYCNDCVNYNLGKDSYGSCALEGCCLYHKYEPSCEKFTKK